MSTVCALCDEWGGELVYQGPTWRVVRVDDVDFPVFYRVIWTPHVPEFSDLPPEDRQRCMAVVTLVEQVVREQMRPRKINLASLGNVVPHLHWHVVARFEEDSHFPQPIWAPRSREVAPALMAQWRAALPALDKAVSRACAHAFA